MISSHHPKNQKNKFKLGLSLFELITRRKRKKKKKTKKGEEGNKGGRGEGLRALG